MPLFRNIHYLLVTYEYIMTPITSKILLMNKFYKEDINSGYNMDHYRIILPPSRIRIMQRSFTSSAFLFPSYNLWNETEVSNYTVEFH